MLLIRLLDVLAVLVALALLGLGAARLPPARHHPAGRHLRLQPAARRRRRNGKGWVLGIGRYAGESLEWYRVFTYATRPRRVLSRRDLQVAERRGADGAEVFALLAGRVVVAVVDAGGIVELAMSRGRPDRLPRLARVRPARLRPPDRSLTHSTHHAPPVGQRLAPGTQSTSPLAGSRAGRGRTAGRRAG